MLTGRATAASGVLLAVPLVALALVSIRPDTASYREPSGSMLPALKVGQHLRVDTSDFRPRVGDIVVFYPPSGAEGTGDTCGSRPRVGRACDRPTRGRASVKFVK